MLSARMSQGLSHWHAPLRPLFICYTRDAQQAQTHAATHSLKCAAPPRCTTSLLALISDGASGTALAFLTTVPPICLSSRLIVGVDLSERAVSQAERPVVPPERAVPVPPLLPGGDPPPPKPRSFFDGEGAKKSLSPRPWLVGEPAEGAPAEDCGATAA